MTRNAKSGQLTSEDTRLDWTCSIPSAFEHSPISSTSSLMGRAQRPAGGWPSLPTGILAKRWHATAWNFLIKALRKHHKSHFSLLRNNPFYSTDKELHSNFISAIWIKLPQFKIAPSKCRGQHNNFQLFVSNCNCWHQWTQACNY